MQMEAAMGDEEDDGGDDDGRATRTVTPTATAWARLQVRHFSCSCLAAPAPLVSSPPLSFHPSPFSLP